MAREKMSFFEFGFSKRDSGYSSGMQILPFLLRVRHPRTNIVNKTTYNRLSYLSMCKIS